MDLCIEAKIDSSFVFNLKSSFLGFYPGISFANSRTVKTLTLFNIGRSWNSEIGPGALSWLWDSSSGEEKVGLWNGR